MSIEGPGRNNAEETTEEKIKRISSQITEIGKQMGIYGDRENPAYDYRKHKDLSEDLIRLSREEAQLKGEKLGTDESF